MSDTTPISCCDCCSTQTFMVAPDYGLDMPNIVRTFDGTLTTAVVPGPDLKVGSFGFDLGVTRSYLNQDATDVGFGRGWRVTELPRVVEDGTTVKVEGAANETLYFTDNGSGSYTAKYFILEKLEYDSTAEEYILTATDGSQKVFDGSSGNTEGKIVRVVNPYGDSVDVEYDANGDLDQIHYEPGGSSGPSVKYAFAYNAGGRVSDVTLSVDGSEARRVRYGYTSAGAGEPASAEGNLESVDVDEKCGYYTNWTTIRQTYYRYDGSGRLEYVLEDDAYKRANSVDSTWPEDATDAELDDYADYKIGYTAGDRVSSVDTRGGAYTYQATYSDSTETDGVNNWKRKAEVTLPDGSTKHTYYFNYLGQMMVRKVTKGSDTWYKYQKFDADSRLVLAAESSAVDTFSEASAGLVTLHSDEGLVHHYTYDAQGYPHEEFLQEGTAGTKAKTSDRTYTSRTARGVTMYFPDDVTTYRGESATGSDPVTTSYTYQWYTDGGSNATFQMSERTTRLPNVPVAENGDNTLDTVVEGYDEEGFHVEHEDARGVLTEYEYDRATGAVTKVTRDAGTDSSSQDYLNLVTDYEVDCQGRVTRELGPVHEVDLGGASAEDVRTAKWYYYNDEDDEVVTVRGYAKVDGNGDVTSEHGVNPVTIEQSYLDDPQVTGGQAAYRIEAEYTGTATLPPASHTYPRSSWKRWRSTHWDAGGEKTSERLYYDIPSSGYGTKGTNYAETEYGYDSNGRRDEVTSPEGTITKKTFNGMGWREKVEVGTSGSNLVEVASYTYANAAGEDGHPSKLTRPVSGTAADDRVLDFTYDWRNRREQTKGNDGTRDYYAERTFDNMDRVTELTRYHTSVVDANRIGQQKSYYDTRGRVYKTEVLGDWATGATALTSKNWYDEGGNLVRTESAGSEAFTVDTYDAVGRQTASYTGYVPDSSSAPSDPSDISGSVIVAESVTEYDDASNVVKTTGKQRFDDATGLGALGDPTTSPKARVNYGASYPDGIGRPQAGVDVGTNGGSSWTRPETVPDRSDTVHVTSFTYDAAGDLTETTDPEGTVGQREYDDAGRVTETVDNYLASPPTPDCGGANRTTRYEYNDDGNMTKLVAENATTGDQTTEWVYGVTQTGTGNEIDSNALIKQKVQPGGGAANTVTYEYNRQGQATKFTDQLGTVHEYGYDEFGRLTDDEVTAFGDASIDDHVDHISRGYDEDLRLEKVESWGDDGSGPVLRNAVEFSYNGFGQLTADEQDHDPQGAVPARSVDYTYADGTDNTLRRIKTVFPSDGVGTPAYAERIYTSEGADKLGRPDKLGGSGTDAVEYGYLGLGTAVKVDYVGLSPDVTMAYESPSGTNPGGDQYSGLDEFGRVIGVKWSDGTDDLVDVTYGYDDAGNRVWRRDEAAHALSNGEEDEHDNYYTYDGLYQVGDWKRGDLTGTRPDYTGITNTQRAQEWCYDATGNWKDFDDDITGGTTLAQTRTHNVDNEITDITNPSGVVDPVYDDLGNTTTCPKPGAWGSAYTLKWDAWNRLVEVKEGSTVVQENAYDGLHRRTTEDDQTDVRHFYYDNQWRPVEEYLNASSSYQRVYLWGLRSRWDLVTRYDATSTDAHWVLYDAIDPVALVDESSDVVERYEYTPFGEVGVMDASFVSRASSSHDWNYLFHGEFMDEATGFYNYGYRYYHTSLGRWLSRDPIGLFGGHNQYANLENNGGSRIDLLGLAWKLSGAPVFVQKYGGRKVAIMGAITDGIAQGSNDWKGGVGYFAKPENTISQSRPYDSVNVTFVAKSTRAWSDQYGDPPLGYSYPGKNGKKGVHPESAYNLRIEVDSDTNKPRVVPVKDSFSSEEEFQQGSWANPTGGAHPSQYDPKDPSGGGGSIGGALGSQEYEKDGKCFIKFTFHGLGSWNKGGADGGATIPGAGINSQGEQVSGPGYFGQGGAQLPSESILGLVPIPFEPSAAQSSDITDDGKQISIELEVWSYET